MTIQSAERLNYDHFILGTFYDRSDNYMPGAYMLELEKMADRERILRNLPYAHRGYVFKDKKLRKYFSQFWWYMPDADYQPSTKDFTAREWKLINEHQ
jgi:GT2 family glycosyltransferase